MSERQIKEIPYHPTPTLKAFHADNSQVRGILGPTGSGKSVGCVGELFFRAFAQEPDQVGIRRTRWGVFRKTYPSLMSTTIKTWSEWAPQAKVVAGQNIHWHWEQKRALSDGTGIDMEVVFIAVQDPRTDIDKLRSLDLTGAWCNEAQEIEDRLLIEWMLNRCGRYPRAIDAPLTWSGLILDANAMSTTHWWYHWSEKVTPTGYKFFHQPPAVLRVSPEEAKKHPNAVKDGQDQWWILNPECENVKGQGKHERYWLDQISGKDTAWIVLNFCAQYGASMVGKPVYPMFDEVRHVAKQPLEPVPGVPLQLGFDYGMTPSCLICQITLAGQLRVLDERYEVGTGMRQFLANNLKPFLQNKYPGWPVMGWSDPGGKQREQSDAGMAIDEIRAVGINVQEAPTNLFQPRRQAVIDFMMKRVHSIATGEQSGEGFLVSPTCLLFLDGLREGYRFGSILVGGRTGYKEAPDKNEYSHVQDCCQYVAVAYDRPKLASVEAARTWGDKPIEIGFDSNYPTI